MTSLIVNLPTERDPRLAEREIPPTRAQRLLLLRDAAINSIDATRMLLNDPSYRRLSEGRGPVKFGPKAGEVFKQVADPASPVGKRRRLLDSAFLGGFTAMALVVGIGALVVACGPKAIGPAGHDDGNRAGAKAETLVNESLVELKTIETNKAGEKSKKQIGGWLAVTLDMLGLEQKARDKSAKDFAKVVGERDTVTNDFAAFKKKPLVIAAIWIEWGWWILAGVSALGFILRLAAMFVGGWAGGLMAKVGAIMLWPAWFIGAALNQFFDNAYFRDRKDKLNPASAA